MHVPEPLFFNLFKAFKDLCWKRFEAEYLLKILYFMMSNILLLHCYLGILLKMLLGGSVVHKRIIKLKAIYISNETYLHVCMCMPNMFFRIWH